MIALDTSSLVSFLSGDQGSDIDQLEMAIDQKIAALPPAVLTELLSDPKLKQSVKHVFLQLPQLSIKDGFWFRAGILRSSILAKGYKARLADTLIAQTCLDHDIPLITRDKDFRHYRNIAGLKLL